MSQEDHEAARTAGIVYYLNNHRRWPVSVTAPPKPGGIGVAKIKRVIEVDGEFIVMVEGESLPVADGLASSYEANIVAMLISTGPYQGKHLSIAFQPNDGGALEQNEESFWYNGREYQMGDDLNEPADALLWYARYGAADDARASGEPIDFWNNTTPQTEQMLRDWVIRVATDHEVAYLLPDAITDEPDEPKDGSADRYHLSLLMDLVRNPGSHDLDNSERRGLLETLERVRANL